MYKRQILSFAIIIIIAAIYIISSSSCIGESKEIVINKTQETQQVNKAYTWLSEQVRNKWEQLGIETHALALLALSWDDNLASQGLISLKEKSNNEECWPTGSCTVKDTALSILALSGIGRNTEKAENWLMLKNGTPSELKWYLQIDTVEEATCSIIYNQDGKEYNITLSKDKKIDKSAGYCLTPSYGNYWLKVSSSCYEKKFTVSCDKDFIANLFYQKPGITTIYLSSDTKKESAGGYIDLKINSICLQQGGTCDYEATAWGALAMLKNRDISIFIPYLVGYAEKNTKIMPEAFLYILTGQEDYARAIVSKQKRKGYWDIGSPYGKYFDTALALFSLENYDSESKLKAKEWLLEHQVNIGKDEGSWHSSKKDTAFILYSIWPKEPTYIPETKLYCTDYGYYCVPSYECDFDLRLTQYYCSGMEICCEKKPEEKLLSCGEMGGMICGIDETCSGTTTSALDGICCLGACRKEEINECEEEEYICRYNCNEDEQEVDFECPGTKVCCMPKIIETEKKSKAWIFWITLIVLIIVLFIFKNKIKNSKFYNNLKDNFFRFSSRKKKYSKFPPSPSMPRGMIEPRPVQRPYIIPRNNIQPVKRFTLQRTQHDKELEETLKRLRENEK